MLPDPYYQDDYATIYHGDCLELLPFIDADVVVTDPPYGTQTHDNAKSNKGNDHDVKSIDFEAIDFDTLRQILGMCSVKWMVFNTEFRHAYQLEQAPPTGFELLRIGVWVKTNPMPQISADRPAQGWEAIAYLHSVNEKKSWNGGGNHGNYVLPVDHSTSHPTSKPPAMIQSFVERFSDEGQTILDPFMGSGTTLRAAKDLGRRSIGIEIKEKYCEIAAKRLAQEVLDFG